MKKILIAALAATFTFAACDDDSNGKYNPDAKLYINGVDRANKSIFDSVMTVAEILRLDSIMIYAQWPNEWGNYTSCGETFTFERGNIDTINNRLVMRVGGIAGIEGNPFFTKDNYFVCRHNYRVMPGNPLYGSMDTLGYVPNAQRREAYEKICALWESEDWPQIYEIFQNAFTFIPCTGAELTEMEKNGTW